MMIEESDAFIANTAMFGSIIGRFDIAQMASAVFYHMRMLGAIEFRHNAIASILEQLWIGGIDE